jgi:uncharacterized protein (DUF1684 family)
MKPRRILLLIVVLVVLVSVYYTFQGGQDKSVYGATIEKERTEKDRFMQTSDDSPFARDPQSFSGLRYFEVDARYDITASLTPIQGKKSVVLATSDGNEQRYLEYALAEFDLDGYHNSLLILESTGPKLESGHLFLAFGDETSASETYGGGRYLDIKHVPGSNSISLDFNKAYNPYCAYVDDYSCPLPPSQNLLRVAIRAGEKTYSEE